MRTAAMAICILFAATACLAEGVPDQGASALAKKLDSIIIPEIELNEANINDVVPYLALASRQHDPAKVGVEIVNMDRDNQAGISLTLKNVSLLKALKLVAERTALTLDLEGKAVVLRKPQKK